MENDTVAPEANPAAAEESPQADTTDEIVANISLKRRRNLDSVITSIVNKRLQKRDHNDGMAMPVFVHSPGGDVLISCRDSACRCKQADHTKFPLFSHPGARHRYNCSNIRAQAWGAPAHSAASEVTSSALGKEKASADYALLSDKQTTSAQLSDMKLFAEYFRRRRFELGYTQKDVAAALAEDPSRLHQMKHRLQKWLDEAERTHAIKNMVVPADSAKEKNGGGGEGGVENILVVSNESSDVRPAKYPKLEETAAERLRLAYSTNAYPTMEEMKFLADETGLTAADVCHWFSACRRQKKMPDFPPKSANGEGLGDSGTLVEPAQFPLL
uniref:Homeobox domain-containing protein n=1 Tax=Trichuris muris TaxID=70415 RepID=A0A5S6QLJ8_TRIMR